MYHTKLVEKIKTHILRPIFFSPRKLCHVGDNVGKYGRPVQATDDNMAHAHCLLNT